MPIPIGLGIGFITVPLTPSLHPGYQHWADYGVAGIFFLVGLTCLAYSAFHAYQAVVRRASDLVLTTSGIRLKGSRGRGTKVGWNELDPPYADVQEVVERQLTVVGTLLFVFSRFSAGSPIRNVTVWKLWLFASGQRRLLAKSDREDEARSMEAAAQSIVSVEEGRRYVAQAPAVPV